ncbi:unnamed protein product [Symbiodinium sp. CCMP2592]|nr:unnamed protein product [Symbiodinium sp. CCMP2592]
MALTDENRRTFLAQNVSADLVYLWEELNVSLLHQYELGQNYRSMVRFAALADTRAGARAAFASDVTVDPDTAAGRAALAGLVAAWQSALDTTEHERKLKAEAHVLGLPKPLPANDRLAMRVALEASLGSLEDREEPSSTYLALKMEEVEAGEIKASLLDEVTCTVDEVNANFQSSVDSSGRLRLTKERKKAKLPTGSEELRQRLRVEAHTFLMLAARFRNKAWFQGLSSKDFLLHVDYVLGDKIYLLQTVRPEGGPAMSWANPSWQLVLNYEHRLRKEAYKQASRNNRSLTDTLKEARDNAMLKETYFVGPLAMEMASRASFSAGPPAKFQKIDGAPPPPTPDPSWDRDRKGKGKGKGKFLGKPSKNGFVFRKTPDGREICYGYNNGSCFSWEEWNSVPGIASRTYRFLYLFAGPTRHSDVKSYLVELSRKHDINLFGLEIDLTRSTGHDLRSTSLWATLSELLKEADAVVLAPPCNTFSRARARWRISPGPPPLRSLEYLHGFPWLSDSNRNLVEDANFLVSKSFEFCQLCVEAGVAFIIEHPEQLGKVQHMIPGSIWDMDDSKHLLLFEGVETFAFFQCQWGDALSKKPTRFMAFHVHWDSFTFFPGAHRLASDGSYAGPLPRHCGHVHEPLLGKDSDGDWKTSRSAAYPPNMCHWLAASLLGLRVGGGSAASGARMTTSQNLAAAVLQPPELFDWQWAPWSLAKVALLGEPSCSLESKSREIAMSGRISQADMFALCDLISDEETGRGRRPGELPTEKLFTSGAYVHGGVCGLRKHCRASPWTTALLACIINCVCPGSKFTSVLLGRDIKTGPHRDENNEPGSHNIVVKAASFSRGGLLLEDETGDQEMIVNGQLRQFRVLGFVEGFLKFDPSLWHATEDWEGTRIVVIGFSIRDPHKLKSEDQIFLERLLGDEDHGDTGPTRSTSSKVKSPDIEYPFHGYMEAARSYNYGDPLTVSWRGLHQSMCDGCGLNSPGRWRPGSRGLGLPWEASDLAQRIHGLLLRFVSENIDDTKKAFFRLALGRMSSAPFSPESMEHLRDEWFRLLPDSKAASKVAEGQPFYLEALSQTSRLLGDEDWGILTRDPENYASGRKVGVDSPFPRVPLVFRPKKKWRDYDDSPYQAINANYSSAALVPDQLEAQFEEEEALGMMFPLSEAEARKRFGDKLHVASLGAIMKDDGTVRTIFDGTHSVKLNNRIRIDDHLEFPGPSCVGRAMEEMEDDGYHLLIGVAADVAKGHRRYKHRSEDHGYLGCRAREDGPIWFNRVGTFGMACAAYHFARLVGLIGRCALTVLMTSPLFQFLFADDLKFFSGGPRKYDHVWTILVFWLMVGTPFKWSKFRGGVQLDYVGFAFDYFRFSMGLSERRANWIIEYVNAARRDRGLLDHRRFVEFVGRLVYAGQVLYWLRPFMAPLHRWKGAQVPGTVAVAPRLVMITLEYIRSMLLEGHAQVSCRGARPAEAESFRTDAKAAEDFYVLGGWETCHSLEPGRARWFSLKVHAQEIPALFNDRGTAEGMSTVAELLATLVALHAFGWLETRGRCFSVSAGTDNLANETVTAKNSTLKFPLAYVQMQLSHSLYKCGGHLKLNWRPREVNTIADDLTNESFGAFDPNLRILVRLKDCDLSLLRKLSQHHDEVSSWSQRGVCSAPSSLRKRKVKYDKTKWG